MPVTLIDPRDYTPPVRISSVTDITRLINAVKLPTGVPDSRDIFLELLPSVISGSEHFSEMLGRLDSPQTIGLEYVVDESSSVDEEMRANAFLSYVNSCAPVEVA